MERWLYTPRPAAVLYVPVRNQPLITTSVPTSHYYIPKSAAEYWSPLSQGTKSNFILQFEFNGTVDATPYLCVPAALKFRQDIGGEDAIIKYCNTLAFEGGEAVAKILGTEIMAPDPEAVDGGRCPMINIRLPLLPIPKTEVETVYNTFTKEVGIRENTFVQVYVHNAHWWVRISAQVYLEMKDFVWIAGVLKKECEKVNERIKSLAAVAAATDVVNGADAHVEEVRSAKVVSGMEDLKVAETEGEAVTVKG